jgi:hypothetical protein
MQFRPSNWNREKYVVDQALWEMIAETVYGRRGFLGGGKGKVAGAEMSWAYLFQGLVVDKAGSIFGHLELTFLDLLAKLPRRERE